MFDPKADYTELSFEPQFIITKNQIDEMYDSLHKTLKQAFK